MVKIKKMIAFLFVIVVGMGVFAAHNVFADNSTKDDVKKYSIKFTLSNNPLGNGGGLSQETTLKYAPGETAILPPSPEFINPEVSGAIFEGYTFGGTVNQVFTQEDEVIVPKGATTYTVPDLDQIPQEAITNGSTINLYAKWDVKLLFDLNGGNVDGNTANINDTITMKSMGKKSIGTPPYNYQTKLYPDNAPKPVRPGYTFEKWVIFDGVDTVSDQYTLVTRPYTVVNRSSYPENGISFTAQWIPSNFNVTYDLNGGSFKNSNQAKEVEVPNGEKITLPSSTEVNPPAGQLALTGWKVESSSPEEVLAAGSSYQPEADVKLVAQYTDKYFWGSSEVSLDNGTLNVGPGEITINKTTYVDDYGMIKKSDVKVIHFEDGAKAPANSYLLFSTIGGTGTDFNNLQTITGNLDTSNVTNMAGMFRNLQNLTSLNLSNWDTSKVTTMSDMFSNTRSLKNLDLSTWDTSNVTNMASMFYQDMNIISIKGLADWDTSNVLYMQNMFASNMMLKLGADDLSNWNTENVTNMESMFFQNRSIEELNLGKWNTSNVLIMKEMFASMTNKNTSTGEITGLTKLDISGWDTSKAKVFVSPLEHKNGMQDMFKDADNRLTIQYLKLGEKSILNDKVGLEQIATKQRSNVYTGGWVQNENNTDYSPVINAKVYTSSNDLVTNYDGSNTGWYTWEELQTKITYDLAGGRFKDASKHPTNVPVGDTITLPLADDVNVPVGKLALTGWLVDDVTYQPGDEFLVPETDVTIQAQYSIKYVDVTYNLAGGSFKDANQQTAFKVVEGETINLPLTTDVNLPEGKLELTGWLVDGNTYDPGKDYKVVNEDTTITAVYSNIPMVTITYQLNGATFKDEKDAVVTVPVGTEITLPTQDQINVVKDKELTGWEITKISPLNKALDTDEPQLGDIYKPGAKYVTNNENIVLDAVWKDVDKGETTPPTGTDKPEVRPTQPVEKLPSTGSEMLIYGIGILVATGMFAAPLFISSRKN